ncbi:Lnb N-terminal periplasmic domain-containing protein [Solirubrum puertoriconensis]|uniref:Lnb N-terminal periplasmic domain-containing protein n=1 Tax=Solirubrum puertoriconensis TaxID=1751427 RepID=UPI001365E038|nr:DUF4105 domain-containing protein [Solirubrum puertoriconensis]
MSESATVSLLTCAPGSETYALFGHSALRITDPVQGIDQVYNYGTFDFQTSHFYWRFVRGNLRYYLSAVPFASFSQAYEQEGRAVAEQVLNLQPQEVQRLYARLESTLHSEARYYRYQFFSDNCSTRLFTLINESTNAPLQLDSARVAAATYRQLLRPYLAPAPWVKLGMNLGLGLPADHQTHYRQRLFLPLELFQAMARATHRGKPLVARQQQVVAADSAGVPAPAGIVPMQVLLGWLLGSVLVWRIKPLSWLHQVNMRVVFGVTGALGCLLAGLALVSLHEPVQANYQLLWLLPSHIALALGRRRSWWLRYAAVAMLLLLLGGIIAAVLGYGLLLPEVGMLLLLLLGQLLLIWAGQRREEEHQG